MATDSSLTFDSQIPTKLQLYAIHVAPATRVHLPIAAMKLLRRPRGREIRASVAYSHLIMYRVYGVDPWSRTTGDAINSRSILGEEERDGLISPRRLRTVDGERTYDTAPKSDVGDASAIRQSPRRGSKQIVRLRRAFNSRRRVTIRNILPLTSYK